MKLTIDRTKWLRGDHDSFLLRERDGKMCCLGFFSLACGLTEGLIRGRISPWALAQGLNGPYNAPPVTLPESMQWSSAHVDGDGLMSINDATVGETLRWISRSTPAIGEEFRIDSEEHREQKIAEIFAKHGVEVEFIN